MTTERTAYISAAIAALTFLGGLAVKLALLIGDALFKLFWKRNTEFVQARAAEQFGVQLERLSQLPDAIQEQTRVMRAVLHTQRQHGEAIAAVSTAVNLALPGADLETPLRRHRARRAGDPVPTDAVAHGHQGGRPDRHESVGEEDMDLDSEGDGNDGQ